jgi:hypothetical protein
MTAQPQDSPQNVETTDPFVAAYGEAEGGRAVPAFGKWYALRDKVPGMPMLKFSKLAHKGLRTDDPAGGAAMYDLLSSVFTPEAWSQFEDDATEAGADSEELFGVVAKAIEVINGFPTSQSSPSPATQPSTSPSSTVSSFEEHKRALGLVPVTPESLAELVG